MSTRCNNDLRLLIPWYVNGTLSKPERLELEEHMAQCPECKAELSNEMDMGEAVRAVEMAGRNHHVTSEVLVSIVEGDPTLDARDRANAERHISTCTYCSEDLNILLKVHGQAAAPTVIPFEPAVRRWSRQVSRALKAQPAVLWPTAVAAAAVLAILLLKDAQQTGPSEHSPSPAFQPLVESQPAVAPVDTLTSAKKKAAPGRTELVVEKQTPREDEPARPTSAQREEPLAEKPDEEPMWVEAEPTADAASLDKVVTHDLVVGEHLMAQRISGVAPRLFILEGPVSSADPPDFDAMLGEKPVAVVLEASGDGAYLVLPRPRQPDDNQRTEVRIIKDTGEQGADGWKWNDVPVSTGGGPFLFAVPRGILTEGDYVITVTAVDRATNSRLATLSFHLFVDAES